MRSRNEYHPLNVRPMIKDERLFQSFACVARQGSFARRRGKKSAPDFVARICDHQSTDESAHAVADQDDALVVRKCALDSVEIAPKQRGSVRIGITSRVTKEPELIMLSYPRVISK